VLVEGVNRVTKHTKAGPDRPWHPHRWARRAAEAPIHVSNVAVVDPDKKPTRIKTRVETVERDGRPRPSAPASACAPARTCERHG
jgi:large subunit ribosomal protein L24